MSYGGGTVATSAQGYWHGLGAVAWMYGICFPRMRQEASISDGFKRLAKFRGVEGSISGS